MAVPRPKRGLVIRYDFLFESDRKGGLGSGKDRPCAIVLTSEPQNDGSRKVLVCPITHRPPEKPQEGIEIPHKVCRHLGFDDYRMWIKVNELNRFTWEEGRAPFGMTPVAEGRWEYGFLPPRLYTQMREGVGRNIHERHTTMVDRDDAAED